MQEKDYQAKIKEIAKNTKIGLKEYSKFVKQENNKLNITFMIFDKNYNPYLVMQEISNGKWDRKAEYVNFSVFALENNKGNIEILSMGRIYTQRHNCFNESEFYEALEEIFKNIELSKRLSQSSIEDLKKDVIKDKKNMRYDELHALEIEKRKYLAKGLGKEMYYFFEYISFIKGAKRMEGVASPLNIKFIQEKGLYKFYKDRGITVEEKDLSLKKEYNLQEMKKYAKRISTYIDNNTKIKVVFPDNTKENVMRTLNKDAQRKTNLISDIKEF